MIKKNIIVVCFANYCRSPVAEKLLQSILPKDQFSVSSAGVIDFEKNEMDKRSAKFLMSKRIKNTAHLCKALTDFSVKKSDLILAMDIKVLDILLKRYPKYIEKFKLFSRFTPTEIINDPHKYTSEKDYFLEMNKVADCADRWHIKLQENIKKK